MTQFYKSKNIKSEAFREYSHLALLFLSCPFVIFEYLFSKIAATEFQNYKER